MADVRIDAADIIIAAAVKSVPGHDIASCDEKRPIRSAPVITTVRSVYTRPADTQRPLRPHVALHPVMARTLCRACAVVAAALPARHVPYILSKKILTNTTRRWEST